MTWARILSANIVRVVRKEADFLKLLDQHEAEARRVQTADPGQGGAPAVRRPKGSGQMMTRMWLRS